MRLVVENGQGLSDATSYIGERDAIDYLPSNVIAQWNEMSIDDRVDRLVTASQFIDASFKWAGTQTHFEQGLSFPRKGIIYQGHIVSENVIPKAIKRACVLALLHIIHDGIDIFRSSAEAQVKKEKLAVMETEYFERKSNDGAPTLYDDINNILRGFYTKPLSGVITAEVLRR